VASGTIAFTAPHGRAWPGDHFGVLVDAEVSAAPAA
jgi:hypothetical protein